MFRYLKDPHLAFWFVACLILLAVTVVATQLGGAATPTKVGPNTSIVAGATSSASGADVAALASLMPSGIAAGTDSAAVATFANSVLQVAAQGAGVRAAEGAPPGDPLRMALTDIADTASGLKASATSPVAVAALRTRLGLQVSRAQQIVAGLPAAPVPDGGPGMGAVNIPALPELPNMLAPTVTTSPKSTP